MYQILCLTSRNLISYVKHLFANALKEHVRRGDE
jgi:hypothetical protein